MSHQKATTPRDFLAGLTFKINISRQPAKEIRSTFTLTLNKEMADRKIYGMCAKPLWKLGEYGRNVG